MIKLVILWFIYFCFVIASCFSYDNGSFSYKIPDLLAAFSGIVAIYAIQCEHNNRNKDDKRIVYIVPLLNLISPVKEIKDDLDIISTMTIHKGCTELKKSIDELQEKTTTLAYKIGNRLQETDKKYGFKNKDFFEQYMEEHIYPSFTHLSQNSRQDENSKKVFQKDIKELKNSIADLVNNLTEMVNKISDKL